MRPVSSLKAWELYTGQSLWFFFIGIVFFLLQMLIGKLVTSTSSPQLKYAYDVIETIGSGQAKPGDGAKFARDIIGQRDTM